MPEREFRQSIAAFGAFLLGHALSSAKEKECKRKKHQQENMLYAKQGKRVWVRLVTAHKKIVHIAKPPKNQLKYSITQKYDKHVYI